jgi:predicted regulator of Ras-like GTPase activity (Roadblock/LC7/MglB family)
VDAAAALTELTRASAQIEGAVLAGPRGGLDASTFEDEERGQTIAQAARELLKAADDVRADGGDGLVQLEAALPDGSVFVVRDGDHLVAAVTVPEPTVGLVFYDLKTCLRTTGTAPSSDHADTR